MVKRLLRYLGRGRWSRLRQAAGVCFPEASFMAIMEAQQGFGPFCTLSFDCDFPRDVEALPEVCSLLEQYGVAASFACIGQWVQRYPAEHRCLVEAGFELLNHTQTHPNLYHPDYAYARGADLSRKRFDLLVPREKRAEIEEAHATFVEVLGYAAYGFRTPHFGTLHTPEVYPILSELKYRFSSSVMAGASPRGGIPYQAGGGVWEFPLSPCPAHPFGVLDSWHSLSKRDPAHGRPGELTSLFVRLGEQVQGRGGYVNIYLDPRDALDSGELRRILDYLRHSGLVVLNYADLLERILADPTRHLFSGT
ncbi:MAG: polysaccharide deacetylase family protein [Candidatus Handelsmanbacteria bacterium]|nr:polysaccharide deacetylase family protein [Candidatus Handelsmanbacteria bacterium]